MDKSINGVGRTLRGRVLSNKMQKTVTVLVERRIKHPIYGKYVNRSTKLHAHDEHNLCVEGDIIDIQQSKPISKTKNWVFVSKVT